MGNLADPWPNLKRWHRNFFRKMVFFTLDWAKSSRWLIGLLIKRGRYLFAYSVEATYCFKCSVPRINRANETNAVYLTKNSNMYIEKTEWLLWTWSLHFYLHFLHFYQQWVATVPNLQLGYIFMSVQYSNVYQEFLQFSNSSWYIRDVTRKTGSFFIPFSFGNKLTGAIYLVALTLRVFIYYLIFGCPDTSSLHILSHFWSIITPP